MKFSQELVWRAVFEFAPNFKIAKANNVNIGITTAIRDAALLAFVESGMNGIASFATDRGYAALVLQGALKELLSTDTLKFGTQTEYWGSEIPAAA